MTDEKKPWEQQFDGGATGAGAQPWKQDYGPDAADAPAAPRGLKGWGRDIAATAVKGAIAVPEALVGLADIPTGGAAGKALANEGGTVGLRFRQAKEMVNDWHSDATKEAQRKFQEADGIVDKTAVALSNPSLIATAVGESLPSMGAGGVAARGLMAATRLGKLGATGAVVAGAAGEGVTMAGSQAEQIRQETEDGLLTPGQAAAAVGTGVVGGAFSVAGGKVAQRLGIGDADTMMAQGLKGVDEQIAGKAAQGAANPLVAEAAVKSIPRKVIEGAIAEGFLEELPQSMAEQIFQNVALGKPWHEELDSAAVMGVLSGGAMGAGAAGFRGFRESRAAGEQAAPGQDAKPLQLGYNPDPLVVFPDGTVGTRAQVDAYVASLPEGEQLAARAKLLNQGAQAAEAPAPAQANPGMARVRNEFAQQLRALQEQEQGEPNVPQSAPPDGAAALAQQQAARDMAAARVQADRDAELAASRAVETPDDEILQSTGAAQRPSEAMGLRSGPAAGTLEGAAAMSVDTGLSAQLQQAAAQAQAAESQAKQAKQQPKKGKQQGGYEPGQQWHSKSGGSYTIESVSADGKLALADFGRGDKAQVHFDAETANGWTLKGDQQQAQAGQEVDPDTGEISGLHTMSDWSDADLSSAFRGAQSPDVRRALAGELSRRRAIRQEGELQAELQADLAAQDLPDAPDDAFASTQEDAGPVPERIEVQGAQEAPAQAPAHAPGSQAQGANVATLAQLNRKKLAEMSTDELHQLSSLLPADHARQQKIQKAIKNRAQKAPNAINEGAKNDGTQTPEAQQGGAQPAQAPAAPAVPAAAPAPAGGTEPAAQVPGIQQAGAASGPAAQGLTDGTTPTQDDGREAGAPAAPQAQAQEPAREFPAKRRADAGAQWTRMPAAERSALVQRLDGVAPVLAKNLPRAVWENLNSDIQGKLADAMAPREQQAAKAAPAPAPKKSKAAEQKEAVDRVSAKYLGGAQVGDAITLSKDFEYATGQKAYRIESITAKGEVHVIDPARGSRTSFRLDLAHANKVTYTVAKAAEQGAPAETPAQAQPADRFADNKLFTADKVAAARERMRKKLGTLNSGIDPELLVDGMTIAGAYIESGVRNFTQYAKAMIDDMGDGVKPYLLSFWEGARNYPGLDNAGMTDPAESARQHQALLTSEAREQAAEQLGEAVAKPAKRAKKTGVKGDMTLTQDWGVEHIDGYGNADRETGNGTKDAFLKEAKQYLNAVADELAAAGFTPHSDAKGKPGKAVSVNESGMAGSGDVTLTVQHPETGTNVYVHVGDTALRGMFPSTASGIAVMARTSQAVGDTYATKGQNRWMPVDLSASDLAALLLRDARGTMEAQTRTTETKEVSNGNPEQPGRAADQGRAPEVSGRGRRDNDPAAPADSGDLESRQPGDVSAPADAGRAGGDGVRVPATDVGRAGPVDQGGNAGDGRTGAGGARAPDAGARKQRSVKAPEEVSPANPGPGNFHLDNPLEIVGGTPVARFDKNMAAIELLNQLRESERQATAEEQRTLAGYTGWGSFGQELFQGTWAKAMPKAGWEKRDQWLRDHLGQDEWESAQRSITNAHYTDPPTVMAMWDMVKRMGFSGGRVLEPSMGIGNFFGMMPADIKGRSHLAGIELDSLTGAMATRLYPDANVKIMGYQESKTPDDFYDVVIGNWPFENTVIADRRYNTLSPFLHDYFFLKALDQVRPGGLVVGITSNGTMDKKATRIRAALARKAELVTSIRLPSGAFQEYAGTKVVTDIVILKKRPQALSLTPNEPWINSVAVKTPAGPEVFINEFYAQNPGNVIGTTDYGHGTTRMQPGMIVHRPDNMAERLRDAVNLVPEGVFSKEDRTKHLSYVTNHTADREGSLSEQNGRLYVVRGEHLAPAQEVRKYALKSEAATAERERELRALIDMRRKYAALIEAERTGDADDARNGLREAYDAFGKAHGDLSDSFGLDYLRKIDDPFYPALAALTVNGKPSEILSKSTIRGARGMENPTPQDAYVLARNRSVEPTLAEIAALAGKPEAEVRAALVKSGAVFEAPNGDVVPSDIYLSGNVRQKLREAQAALAEGDKAMERNVAELKKVIPEDVPYFNIESQLGATWVPARAYAEYVAHMLNRPSTNGIEATFLNGRWKIRLPDGANHWTEARTGFGTGEYPFSKLVNAAFTNQTVKIRRKDSDGNEYVDTEASDEANARIGDIRAKFGEWLWSDPERRTALEAEYNESRNAYATPKYDGSFLHLDGMALSLGRGPFNLRQHQVNAIWRALVNRRSLNAHEVGTGKTFTMGGIAVESRRYGIAKKPVLLAHNANSASVAAEIQMMYPAAKVLYIDNLDKDSIAVRMRQIANDDWDTIVMPHSLIDRLSFREETLMEMAREDIRSLEEEAYAAAEEDGVELTAKMMDDEDELKKVRSITAKELVKARNRIIETIKKQAMQSSREGAIPFEDLGIDMVLVDEAHEFKKPPISTRMNMKGLNTQTSNRSIALQFITRYIRANNFGGNVHTFTGTPITNTLTEIFHQMRYVMEDEMKAAGVESWDGWFGSFAKEVQDVELSAAGEYEAINRLAGFINVPELRRMIGQYMDVVFAEDMPEMQPRKVNGKTLTSADLAEAERAELLNGRTENATDRPYKKVVNVTSDLTDEQSRIFSQLQGYARSWRNMSGKARKEAMYAGAPESPIITEGLANKASFDVRLMDDEAYAGQEGSVPDSPGSKASKVVGNVLEIYNSDDRAAQVIFAEQGFSTSKDKSMGRDPSGKKITRRAKTFSTMRDIVERLVQGGIPREQIAIVDGSTSKEKRKEIANAMNALTVRVVIGSTDTLGVGVNMQRNLRAMHHMDAPYMPGELEQRNGRGLRQGNQWNTVLEYRYMTDRLDGRRWQILAIKQRFITAFMKANSDARVIEGDAASDEESDIVQSFSEAAGDPRILIRAKLRKNVEALQRAERMHGNGVADARRNMRNAEEAIQWNRGMLRQMRANDLPQRLRAMMQAQSENFTATVQGQAFDNRKDAEDAIDKFLKTEMRMEQSGVTVATYRDQTITARWPSLSSQPELVMEVGGQEFSSGGLRGLEQQVRNFPGRIEKVEGVIAEREASIERLQQVSKAPFARAVDLEAAQKRLEALEKDIEVNPVPPPAWLRAGAPVDSEAFRAGRPFVVTGHRWTKDGWFVLGQDAKGEMAIPFTEVMDAQGMPLYEAREFNAPEVIEKDGSTAPAAGVPVAVPDAAGAGQGAADFQGEAKRRPGSAQDKAVMQAIADGKSARDVLRLVAEQSKDPFLRKVARLLLRAGITPNVQFGHIGKTVKGTPIHGQYRGRSDTIAMAGSAEYAAERIFMHEAMHAATMRALAKGGLPKMQLQKLLEHVRKQKGAAGFYGTTNVDEFVAEVFTNPDFQRALRQMTAPNASTLKTAWDSFLRTLKRILGLNADATDALSQALELGVAAMRQDMALRTQGVRSGKNADSAEESSDLQRARVLQGQPVAVLRLEDAPAGGFADIERWAADLFARQGGGAFNPEIGEVVLDARAAKSSLAHGGANAAKKIAFAAVKDVIEKGALVYRTAVGNKDSFYVSAPVRLSGRDNIVTVLVRRDHNTQRMYLHSVSTKENLLNPRVSSVDAAKAASERSGSTNSGDEASVANEVQRIKATSAEVARELHRLLTLDTTGDDVANFGADDLARLKTSALDQISQSLSHPGKVSWWDKSFGTMRNLAERVPQFKPVFEAAQRFIDDVSMLANDAADFAPRLMPRVETLADLKKKPITADDNKAVAKPLFEGTLMWARDVDGTPVTTEALNAKYRNVSADEKAQIMLRTGKLDDRVLKMWKGMPLESFESAVNSRFDSTILKPGVVWSGKELKDLFKLSDQQLSLYQEARAAIDRSIDVTARTDMLRVLGEQFAGLRDVVLEQQNLKDAFTLVVDTLQDEARANPDMADRLMQMNNAVVNRYETASELMAKGYAPLSRFGRYTVDVVDQAGERQFFGMFESMREANQMAMKMRDVFKGANVTQGTMSQQAFKLFAGITPESLEQFGSMLGLQGDGNDAKDKAFQAYLQLAKNNHSALKRLIHRKGIDGYSEDVGRVLASFVYSNARLGSGGLNAGTMEQAVEAIPKEMGELRDVAMGLRSYIQDPQEEGQAVRGMLFAQYLGGSVASAFVNMTQPFQITMPWLSQYGGMRKAAGQMARALKDMGTKGFKYEADLARALQLAEDDGTVSPQEIHQLMAQARGTGSLRTGDGTKLGDARAAASNNWERVKVAWGQPFALAEQFNRRSTFIASYRIAKDQGIADPGQFARKAVLETQFLYSKANKMRFGRGAVGGTLMTFRTYSVSYLELMNRMWNQGEAGSPERAAGRRAVGWAVAMLLLMGGAGGLPFVEDIEDLIDGAGQLMGYNLSSKQVRKEFLASVVGKELADFAEQGVSGLPGAPIDVSGRLGMGNLIPGTGLFMNKQNRERDLLEIAGPAGDLVARGFTGARKALTGDVAGAAMEFSPTAVRNAAKGIDMATSGIYKDTKGYKVIDVSLAEAASKFIGFQPKNVAEVQEANSFMQRTKSFYTATSSDIKAQWAQALFEKDDAALQRVRDRLSAWNRDNPEQPIKVSIPDIMKRVRQMGKDKADRIADTSPKALRAQMREMAQEASR
ncbi:hypothetical protein A4F85_04570 [Delftia sp. GW456-R20]|uniref:PLxRFG domain-containing protein n=1 Tax=Delftia sp. GW456-R20 TaxID=1827145 RepID=UPI0007AED0FF|nr:PLxRFG domain-containing protein [Delftia sp. GW456-R20]KZK31995.1 hypothetical protein A4F85_04570 [Delftia sp. GW456-R20]